MLLALDVGNTNTVIGVFDGKALLTHWRLSTRREGTRDEYGMLIKGLFDFAGLAFQGVSTLILSSVVPPLQGPLEEMARQYFGVEPMVVGPGIKTGMPILYESPRDVGADRIVNAVAAFEAYGGPCIVVDFGTATTFDAISARGEYLGGAICPGIGISSEALFQHAAKLPRVDIARPKVIIGKNTVGSMQAGLFYGYLSLVEGIVARMRAELGGRAAVVATGGLAQLLLTESTAVDHVDPLLTLTGLRILFERNQ
ncbi:MAG: pantothenate kinase [candidate division NC10 bacterium RIFCSPLOWO2_12_FULL_66_18]|jgi:type III pantothenate kinase|nr:MAG: pantothenate kinase [candidate division NC10 bacterium RIFCSPLOWO2_02_FULL_66_22]OGB96238.1 MAG: pantothenate kinase [candidate division NC10 bacterium RIFCSPLOWO2_12_FULL_66_18]